jgi:hypothetical protein
MSPSKTHRRSVRSLLTRFACGTRSHLLCRRHPDFLSWGSQRSPLHRTHEPVVLSRNSIRRWGSFGVRTLPLTRGPPLPFLTTSTVFSDWLCAGLLHPAAGHGVHHVSASLARGTWPRVTAWSWCPVLVQLPRGAQPFEAFPSSPALRCVTTADTLSPLLSVRAACAVVSPPSCWLYSRVSPTSRSCSDAESVAAARCCHLETARCSLGLVPLKASALDSAPRRSLREGSAPGPSTRATPEGLLRAVEPCGRLVSVQGLPDLRGGACSPWYLDWLRLVSSSVVGSVIAGGSRLSSCRSGRRWASRWASSRSTEVD